MRNSQYKMFHLHEYVNYCTSRDATSSNSAAKYFAKKAIFPYSSPLVLHVASHIKRLDHFDLKAPLRRLYSEYDPNLITLDDEENCHQHNWWQSPVFDQLRMPFRDVNCYVFVEVHIGNCSRPNHPYPLQELHLYHLLDTVSEQLGLARFLETV